MVHHVAFQFSGVTNIDSRSTQKKKNAHHTNTNFQKRGKHMSVMSQCTPDPELEKQKEKKSVVLVSPIF